MVTTAERESRAVAGYRDAWVLLAASAVALPHTGTTSETVLATVPVPSGIMGANGILRVTMLWGFDTSANNKIGRMRFGASGAGTSGTAYFSTGNQTTNLAYRAQNQIENRGAANSQVGHHSATSGFAVVNANIVTSAIDTTAGAEIAFTAALASGGDAMRLESYLVEIMSRA